MRTKKKAGKISPAKTKSKSSAGSKPRSSAIKYSPAISKIAKPVSMEITHEMIVKQAHLIWEKKCHAAYTNNELQNWLEAEAELRGASGK